LNRNGFKRSESGFDTNETNFCPFQSILLSSMNHESTTSGVIDE